MKIGCICVLYNPKFSVIKFWKNMVLNCNLVQFIFVDNSNYTLKDFDGLNNCIYNSNRCNLGIAEAQNIGIKLVWKLNLDVIVFFDQDSEFEPSYFRNILYEYENAKLKENKLAILGPTILNKDSMREYKNNDSFALESFSSTPCLISSGTIVESSMFIKIGLFEAKLFIDMVDFEWCFRANSLGYCCAKTRKVSLSHKVGQGDRTFLGFPIIISSPFRYYYQYRNVIALCKRKYIPTKWKLKNVFRRIVEFFVVPFMAKNGIETIKNMAKGVISGFKY